MHQASRSTTTHNDRSSEGEDTSADSEMKRNLARLAKVCKVSEERLAAQFADVQPMAATAYAGFSQKDASSMEAWQKALVRLAKSQAVVRRAHPTDALRAVFLRYAAWSGTTTSGQEHVHSKMDWVLTARRRCMSMELERDEIKLLCDSCPPYTNLIEDAQRIWQKCYGLARRPSDNKRLDTGLPKKQRRDQMRTMNRWVVKRRTDVTAGCQAAAKRSFCEVAASARELGASAWTPGHDKEVAFNQKKRRMHYLDSINQGHILDSETSRPDRLDAKIQQLYRRRLDIDRNREHANLARIVAKKPLQDLNGKKIFCSETHVQQLSEAINSLQLDVVDRTEADVYVAEDPTNPGQRTSWSAALRGGCVAVPRFISSGGLQGAALVYKAATRTKRFVWISSRFTQQHPTLDALLRACAFGRGSKWTTTSSPVEFGAAVLRTEQLPQGPARVFQNVGLVTVAEKKVLLTIEAIPRIVLAYLL